MSKLISMMAVLLSTTVGAPTVSLASGAPANCPLRAHHINSVVPYRVKDRIGKNATHRLRGADLVVQATSGLSAESLQASLVRHIAAMSGPAGMPDCVLDVDDVKVRVDAHGSTFHVRIVAPDTRRAEEVLRRARLLLS